MQKMRYSLVKILLIPKISRYLAILILAGLVLLTPGETFASSDVQQDVVELVIVGKVLDSQDVPVIDAEVLAITTEQSEPLAEAHSQEDGTWILAFPEMPLNDLQIEVSHPHFQTQAIDLQASEVKTLNQDDIYLLEDVVLGR